MEIGVWTIGRARGKNPYLPLIADYARRLPKYIKYKIEYFMPVKQARAGTESLVREQETDFLLRKMRDTPATYCVLDERGETIGSSFDFAARIAQAREDGRRLVFVVGGSYGWHENMWENAYPKYRISTLVLPRYLVLLILSEQIYRAITILNHQGYHH